MNLKTDTAIAPAAATMLAASPASGRCESLPRQDAASTAVVITSTLSIDTNHQEEMAFGSSGFMGGHTGLASAVDNSAYNAIDRVLK